MRVRARERCHPSRGVTPQDRSRDVLQDVHICTFGPFGPGRGAGALERRPEADGRYQNCVRKTLLDAAQARRLPPAEPAPSRARRDRSHRALAVHAGLDRKPGAAHGVPSGPQQGRGAPRPRTRRVRPFPGPHPRSVARRSAKARHGPEPGHRRDHLLELIVYGQSRGPPAATEPAAGAEPAQACLAAGLGPHRPDGRLRLELPAPQSAPTSVPSTSIRRRFAPSSRSKMLP